MTPEHIKALNESVPFAEFKKLIIRTILELDSLASIEDGTDEYIAREVIARKQAKLKLIEILKPLDIQVLEPQDASEYAVD